MAHFPSFSTCANAQFYPCKYAVLPVQMPNEKETSLLQALLTQRDYCFQALVRVS
jgi:hypothetical protein